MLLIGWWLLPITLFHCVPLYFSALSWRALLPRSSPLGVAAVTWIRWVRESINSLLPVGGVGGDLVSARLAHQRGVAGSQAAASMVVDVTVGVMTQLIFVVIGVVLLVIRSTDGTALLVAWTVLIGILMFVAAIAAFIAFQHRGMLAVSTRLVRRLLPSGRSLDIENGASAIDNAVVALYRRRRDLSRAGFWRLVGWAAGTGETWLVLQFLAQPRGVVDAFILESLGAGVRGAAFMVPGALGLLEGSSIVFGALFGLPAEAALAISLAKRVRELALGLPGLVAWHWVEGHRVLRRARSGIS